MAERFRVGDEAQKSGGDSNVLTLGDSTKIRLLDDSGVGGIAWRQHTIKHADDEDQVEFVACPGPKVCPLCRKPVNKKGKQNFPVSRRFATNVWDYGSGAIKVLIAGPQVFDEFNAAKAVNIDPTSCDWIVHKMGKGIQTKYKMVRDNASPFEFAEQVGPDDLINLDKYGADTSPEKIFELLDKAGIDYDAIETQTFTEQEALEFVIPFGQCKNMTVEQALAQNADWCEWLHDTMLGEERINDPVFLALHTAMQARGLVDKLGDVEEGSSTPTEATSDQATTPAPAPEGPQMEKLLDPEGNEVEVPVSAVPSLLDAGFKPINEDQGSSESQESTETVSEPAPIPKGRAMHVEIAGATVPMKFGAAFATLKAGTLVEFRDSAAADYAQFLLSTGGEPPDLVEVVQSTAEDQIHKDDQEPQPEEGDDKPFKCSVEGCDWSGKTQGSLTQHTNKEHGDIDTSAEPESTGDKEVVLERVKNLLAKHPKDYKQLLNLFEEVAGKRDISKFTDDELLKLEEKLKNG